MTYNFELPLISLIFILILFISYFSEKKVSLKENKFFKVVLFLAFSLIFLDTIIHFIETFYSYDLIIKYFNDYFIFINKIDLCIYIAIFSCLLLYTIFVSYKETKIKSNLAIMHIVVFDLLSFIIIYFSNLNVVNSVNVSVFGAAIIYTYAIVAFLLLLIIIITISNFQKDKRFYSNFFILFSIILLCFLNNKFTGLAINSLIIVIISYIMYFSIEDPDIKLITELNKAKMQAEKASRAKTDFLSSMSHEIRTPLNAIVGLCDVISENNDCPESIKEDIKDIISASHTLLDVVGNILDINKIESDKIELREGNYNLQKEIESLIKINAIKVENKQIDFTVDISKNIPKYLYGDKKYVKQIINNLLSNAIKYTDKGFIKLIIRSEIKKDLCYLIISCKDTGKGIKKEDKDKLFTKFERLDVPVNSSTEGTGLGLALTKTIVDQMEGTIKVETKYGKGSNFIIKIPQKVGEEIEFKKNNISNNFIYKNKKILLVEDNKLNIKILKKMIKSLGFEQIDICYNGKECLNKIKSGTKYDLILMDIMMPVLNGIETLKELQKNKYFKTPVFAVTADALIGAKEKYLKIGFSNYIAKPFNCEILKNKIDKIFLENDDKWSTAPTYVTGQSNVNTKYC